MGIEMETSAPIDVAGADESRCSFNSRKRRRIFSARCFDRRKATCLFASRAKSFFRRELHLSLIACVAARAYERRWRTDCSFGFHLKATSKCLLVIGEY